MAPFILAAAVVAIAGALVAVVLIRNFPED